MTTTQPSSTPITAEGAALRDGLLHFIKLQRDSAMSMDAYVRHVKAKLTAALAATESAAIQQAGEADAWLYTLKQPGSSEQWASIDANDTTRWPLPSGAVLAKEPLYLRAPQDAKAEQASRYWRSIVQNVVYYHKQGMWDAATAMFKLRRCLDDDAPAASNVEAAAFERLTNRFADTIADAFNALADIGHGVGNSKIKLGDAIRAIPHKSAPIEAGEMEPVLIGMTDRFSWTKQEFEAVQAYGQLCRDTARPASSVTSAPKEFDTNLARQIVERDLGDRFRVNGVEYVISRATKPASTGSVADDAEFWKFACAWRNVDRFKESTREARELVAYIDAHQSVAAPDARDAALEEATDALDEAGSKLQTDDKSHDFWMGVGAAVEAGEKAIRALKAVQGKASDAEDGVTEMELALYRDAYGTQAPSEALIAVIDERQRQITAEGWTPKHDDAYTKYEMRWAAVCYALTHNMTTPTNLPASWPWAPAWWKPTTERRNLVKAGALILAEIERLDRDAARAQQQGGSNAAD